MGISEVDRYDKSNRCEISYSGQGIFLRSAAAGDKERRPRDRGDRQRYRVRYGRSRST